MARRRAQLEAEPPSWRERLQALRHVPPLLGLVWETHRGFTITMMALRVLRAFVPVAGLWVGKLIIDSVIAARTVGPSRELWTLVGLELGIVVAGEILARASSLVESLLGDLFGNRLSVRLMEHAATLDLAQFEDPAFYDQLERARRQTVGRIGLLTQLLGMGQGALTLLTLGGAIVAFAPWLLVLLALAVIPAFLGETHFAALGYSLLYRWTPERRQLDYLRMVGASERTAKEVQMFGLAPWLTERYRVLADRFYEENRKLSIRKAFVSTALSFIGTLGYYAAYVVILLRAVQGSISVGTLTFLAASFSRSRDLVQQLLLGASDIYEQSLYLRDLFAFFEMRATITSKPGARHVPRPIREGFVFENVGFQYPGSDRWAVRGVSFRLAPGERLALVGENGAGKTTLTKLLARLYDPTEGRILLEGTDLRDYDLADLRRAIAVIFQDFVRYDMRFEENIGVGEIDGAREYLDASAAAPSDGAAKAAGDGAGVSAAGRHRGPSRRAAGSAAGGVGDAGGARGAPPGHQDTAPTPAAPHHPGAERTTAPRVEEVRSPGARGAPPEHHDTAATLADPHHPDAGVTAPSPEARTLPAIAGAAHQSLASSLLPRLPQGYQTMLGRRFDDGVDLSGGEWQKVALARAYMRDAQVLILDEPTAALDARAEYEVFLRFSELMAGRTAVLISHRFSTVRMADRIVVLEDGRVSEEGTHDELVARGGLYAELFQMQAAGYR